MKEKRILLAQNDKLFQDIKSDFKQFLPSLNNLKNLFDALETETFTNDVFKEITQSGTERIESKFIEKINIDFDKLGITNNLIRENILKGSTDLMLKFLACLEETKNFRPITYSREIHLDLEFISFDAEVFLLTNMDHDNILESKCRIYIETDTEYNLYKALNKFIDAFHEFDKDFTEIGCIENSNADKIKSVSEIFLISINGKYEIRPSSISWAVNRKALIENARNLQLRRMKRNN